MLREQPRVNLTVALYVYRQRALTNSNIEICSSCYCVQ